MPKRAIACRMWGRAAVLGTAAGLALLVYWGAGRWFDEPGVLDIAILILFVSAISDALLAWENERAIAEGRSKLFNDVVGELAVVETGFSAQGRRFRGRVRLGLERWSAHSDGPLQAGERVRVSARQGLLLRVERSSIAA